LAACITNIAGLGFGMLDEVFGTHRSVGVVVDPPFFDDLTGFLEVGEQVLVEALVTEPAIEALDEAILHRFAWCNVAQSTPRSCCQARMAFEVSSVGRQENRTPNRESVARTVERKRDAADCGGGTCSGLKWPASTYCGIAAFRLQPSNSDIGMFTRVTLAVLMPLRS
jgi:hypothetical protein